MCRKYDKCKLDSKKSIKLSIKLKSKKLKIYPEMDEVVSTNMEVESIFFLYDRMFLS